ncbi:hypothetical protein BJ508DRAFT_366470 [Ascobolus immersus RN42]|uniref:Uncharacterized protein n=1 Tax=Ascobolus immersus RN42 TaxID=1160509 RepID=A0A3N4HWD9_ASCIM|nr:hypothetical protein BJ508DRAFT_366470 [Ascobolus immersus RN42]
MLLNLLLLATILQQTQAIITNCDIPPAICPLTLQDEPSCPITDTTVLSSLGITEWKPSKISDKVFTWTIGYRETTGSESHPKADIEDSEAVPGPDAVETDDLLALQVPPPPPPPPVPGRERSYYLGVPGAWVGKGVPPVQSQPEAKADSPTNPLVRIDGCALFFEEASQHLQFPGEDPSTSNGVCADVLGVGCTADLVELARTEFANLTKIDPSDRRKTGASPNFNSYNVCHLLRARLRDSPPASCVLALADGKTWGAITARSRVLSRYTPIDPPDPSTVLAPITSAPLFPINGTEPICHPTTADTSYAILPIFTSFTAKSNTSIPEEQIKWGVTPVLTLWYTNSTVSVRVGRRTEDRHNLTMVEGSVACLKPVGTKRLRGVSNDHKADGGRLSVVGRWGWGVWGIVILSVWRLS